MSNIKDVCCKLAGVYGRLVGQKYFKLEPTIRSSDTDHIGIHGGVEGRTDRRSYDDVIAKTKHSRVDGLPYFLNHGAPRARHSALGAPLLIIFQR